MIAIIGTLVALLLPAVQAAREAARRAQCTNQLKQIGLAVNMYESSYKKFPPGNVKPVVVPDNNSNDPTYMAWTIAILPFLEHQPLFDLYDNSLPNYDVVN